MTEQCCLDYSIKVLQLLFFPHSLRLTNSYLGAILLIATVQ